MIISIPNLLTILRILLTPFFLYFFFSSWEYSKLVAMVFFFIASITDFFDGHLARKHGMITTSGKFLDPLADKILVLSAFLSFYFKGQIELWMVAIVVLRDVIVTGIRFFMLAQGRSMVTRMIAKWKTTIQMVFIYFLLTYNVVITLKVLSGFTNVVEFIQNYQVIYIFMLLVTAITFYTGILYLLEYRNTLKSVISKTTV
jgi:CDP-diacylglycerol--glycerol-3-phosphate 3-phosphatidyltransferase